LQQNGFKTSFTPSFATSLANVVKGAFAFFKLSLSLLRVVFVLCGSCIGTSMGNNNSSQSNSSKLAQKTCN